MIKFPVTKDGRTIKTEYSPSLKKDLEKIGIDIEKELKSISEEQIDIEVRRLAK